MKFSGTIFKKLTLVSAAGYILIFAVAAKGVSLYESHHPEKDELISVNGVVRKVKLGGGGKATSFQIEAEGKTSRYSSYYGKVWSGMEHIREGDQVNVLAERNRLRRDELILGKQYYIWELIHRSRVIVAYEDIHELVQRKEEALDQFINGFLIISALLLVFAYIRRLRLGNELPPRD